MTQSHRIQPLTAVLCCWLSQALMADAAAGTSDPSIREGFGPRVTELLQGIAGLIESASDPAIPSSVDSSFDDLIFGGQLINWNRAQSTPPITIGRELEVAAAVRAQLQTVPEPAPPRPKNREVARIGDMDPSTALRVGLDGDGDVYLSTTNGDGSGIEFCTVGSGGGKSTNTHAALVALMVAMEIDNAADPRRDWWAKRMGSQSPK